MADVLQEPPRHPTPQPADKAVSRISPDSTDTGLKMDQGPSRSDSGTGGGLVNNTQPLTEEEAEQMMAPKEFYEEEERLRALHEEQAAAEAAKASTEAAALSQPRFNQLDALLDKAHLFTKFLTEQMAVYHAGEGEGEGGGEEEEQDEEQQQGGKKGDGGKRRKSGGKKAASKRQKTSGAMAAMAAKGTAAAAAAADAAAAGGSLAERQKALVPLIEGELRDYQLAGVTWLISLYQNGLNGILADQMGLGKTVQTVAFLSHLRAKGVNGPFLIIGPLSTLRNWAGEVRRWCPSMPVLEYHGSGAKARAALRAQHMPLPARNANVARTFPVVCSTYEIVMADIKALARYEWKYVIVDEGHRLKNFNCKLIRDLKTLPADNKLLLTGTPLQNNLSELWSLLNFLLPDIFVNLADFQSWFDIDGVARPSSSSGAAAGQQASLEQLASEQRSQVLNKLHVLVKPFMLRRIKADVEIALPRKQEILLYAPMSEEQVRLNTQLLDKTLGTEMARLADSEGTSSGGLAKLNNVLMQMRKNCNHPDLITSAFTADVNYPTPEVLTQQSGKLALLDRMLKKLQAGGHKVLIFSQMTKMLDLLESYLEQSGHTACRLDGGIPYQARQQAIEDFNSDPKTWLFLLSTRAGGLGINLTAADTVIIYDSDWNPCADLQAMDRCHRIGQTRPVLVFRLATSHSVEGKMLRRAADKMALERMVIRKGVFKEVLDVAGSQDSASRGISSSLSANELLQLLRSDFSMEDVPQSGAVSDDMLDRLLDRSWMLPGSGNSGQQQQASEEGGEAAAAAEGSSKGRRKSKAAAVGGRGGGDGAGSSKAASAGGPPYPSSGVGYEVVQAMDMSVLSNVNS